MTLSARRGFWFALLVTGLGLFAGVSAGTGNQGPIGTRLASHAAPTVHAGQNQHSTNLREAQSVRLVSTEQRTITADEPRVLSTVLPRGATMLAELQRRLSWCDVVQCRRSAGASLLEYATPPPALIS